MAADENQQNGLGAELDAGPSLLEQKTGTVELNSLQATEDTKPNNGLLQMAPVEGRTSADNVLVRALPRTSSPTRDSQSSSEGPMTNDPSNESNGLDLKSEVHTEINALQSESDGLKQEIAYLKSGREAHTKEINGLQSRSEGLKQEIANLKSDREARKKEINSLTVEINNLTIENKQLKLDRDRREQDADEWERAERENPTQCCFERTTERDFNNLVDLKYDEIGDTPEDRRKKRVLRLALEEGRNNLHYLEGKMERRRKQIDGLKFEIYQLVGLFSVFAGVVFAAVTQPNRLLRQHLWSPLILTLFAFLVICIVTVQKFEYIENLETLNSGDNHASKKLRELDFRLRSHGHVNFNFTRDTSESKATPDPRSQIPRFVTLALSIFLLLLWGSFFHIILTKGPSCDECSNSCPYLYA